MKGWPEILVMAAGFTGQALFTLRMLTQWLASERAKRSVAPPSFWWFSVAGTILLIVYAVSRGDPVLLFAPAVNLGIYLGNLRLVYRRDGGRSHGVHWVWAFLLGALLTAPVALRWGGWKNLGAGWLELLTAAAGLAGTVLWTVRFPWQWWLSERRGKSLLPLSFWWISLAGSALLFLYAALSVDWVFMLAYGVTPIPCIRNIMLWARERKTQPPAAARPDDPPTAIPEPAVPLNLS